MMQQLGRPPLLFVGGRGGELNFDYLIIQVETDLNYVMPTFGGEAGTAEPSLQKEQHRRRRKHVLSSEQARSSFSPARQQERFTYITRLHTPHNMSTV